MSDIEYRFESCRDLRSLEERVNRLAAEGGWRVVTLSSVYLGHGHGEDYVCSLSRVPPAEPAECRYQPIGEVKL